MLLMKLQGTIAMNVYDFDKTIYRGDSSCDFYWFCLRRHKKIVCRLPAQTAAFVRHYLLHTISKTQMKEIFYQYFRDIPDMERELQLFWSTHAKKIEPYYLAQQRPDDVIISASPAFFLQPICHELGISRLIASEVDGKTGYYSGENCHGAEKVKRFFAQHPNEQIEQFYSDSLSDSPMAALAEEAYLVKNGDCKVWPKVL